MKDLAQRKALDLPLEDMGITTINNRQSSNVPLLITAFSTLGGVGLGAALLYSLVAANRTPPVTQPDPTPVVSPELPPKQAYRVIFKTGDGKPITVKPND